MVREFVDDRIQEMAPLVAYELYWATKTAPDEFIKESCRERRSIVP